MVIIVLLPRFTNDIYSTKCLQFLVVPLIMYGTFRMAKYRQGEEKRKQESPGAGLQPWNCHFEKCAPFL